MKVSEIELSRTETSCLTLLVMELSKSNRVGWNNSMQQSTTTLIAIEFSRIEDSDGME